MNMRIEFEDFVPAIEQRGFFKNQYESLRECLDRANEWIENAGVDVVNVETIVLPNLWREEGSEDPEVTTSGDMMSTWYQFVRVWYRS
jgi:hypothetical protein